ncbi:MAG: sortase [Anaerolineales bacterium]|nr:MAG: sortase [Anaerolineales bacterium]
MRLAFFSFFRSHSFLRLGVALALVLTQAVIFMPAGDVIAAPASEIGEPLPIDPAPLRDGEPQLILTKTVDDGVTEVQVGDVIRYRIRWECSSLTTSCGEMEITDVLQDGLDYLPPPNSSVPSGFNIGYNSGTRTVTITKADNNLLDGTQYDAVIVVRVSQDFRPLPAFINNTVNGRIDPPGPVSWQNAVPASAPPIEIGGVSPSWELTKTRIAPVIEPTVDTDVTYQLRLCPVPPPSGGIAALTDVVFSDTLPAGAVFVSASNGGTESGGVVTWPSIAGPLYPPSCINRFVTILYPSTAFNIGDELTNSAGVIAGYTDSNGDPCPDCFAPPASSITHDIINIVDVPTYSKGDAGDPVGITGTARFVLDLNTNGTNYPANDVTLIDNLPPELEVTSVTSGTWSVDFYYVRAYVEYSTNNGSTWTAFPGQPVSYNTNAVFAAPVANITNVRWRFEYDVDGDTFYTPGLPYVWGFSSRPEIRVTPRAVPTVADPPSGTPMPAAVVDTTYTNCVYVTRTNAGGPVTDPCANEGMLVRGDYVSLRVSKNETPGRAWDEWEDPDINTFVSDATILPGDTLRYVLTVDMTERSSAPLVNPTILDTLPDDLIFVRDGNVRLNGAPLPGGASVNFTRSGPNPGAGQTLLWEFSGLTVNEQLLGSNLLTVEFFARIPRGQLPGTRTNTLSVDTDSVEIYCEIGTRVLDTCVNVDTYVVDRSAALRGEKWIRSVAAVNSTVVRMDTFLPDPSCPDGGTSGLFGSNPFTRFPCISQAYPEGALNPGQYLAPPPGAADLDDFEYQLRIFNDGNVNMLNYVLYDILPYFGDNGSGGTLASSARLSEFRPVMTDPVVFLGGAGLIDSDFTIEYNLTTNPCRPEVFNQNPGDLVPAACNNTWLPAASIVDWSTVRSYRIRLNSGEDIAPYAEGDPTNIVRFSVPMSIPKDSPLVGVFNNDDAQSYEIAWNSFSHVGSYTDLLSNIRDLLASEPRKVGITIPERFSIGNRVWRDSDNSGTINPPDDTDPGIAGVLVELYEGVDVDNNGIPDNLTPIASTTTDSGGYYLFSNLPGGNYIVGIPESNFNVGQPLADLRSSTGTPPDAKYTTAPLDANVDSEDHGRDPALPGQSVYSPIITLSPGDEPEAESDLSANDHDGPAGTRRGLNGERDYNSDLTVDFGFFGGTDIPFSIGNHLWFDDGTGGGVLNDGIRQPNELPVVGARVDLYRDGNLDGNLSPDELIRFDITDDGGFYLFDNLDPGSYYVVVSAGNFTDSFDPDGPAGPLPTAPGVLRGWYSSHPTGTENVGVPGNTSIPNTDSDDNGINTDLPETQGVRSGVIVLARGVDEPLGESHLSMNTSMAPGFNPTTGDGPDHIGRFGETDATSNMTIDFGFIPPMSLGNRVWFDSGAGEATFREGYNNGIQDGTEPGAANVRVELWRDTNGTAGLQVSGPTPDTFIRFTTTDANGYYLFDRLQPGDNYYVHIPTSNFTAGSPLRFYISSYDRTPPADDFVDMNDNGIDAANPASTGVTSPLITMAYGTEPLTPGNEIDINNSGTYGPENRGNYGQTDANSNLTIDFGFVRTPRSIGNYLWFDTGAGTNTNNRIFDVAELPVANALVRLYRDTNNDGQPDDLGVLNDASDDWIAWDVTDSNGYYLFDNLPPGRYIVGVDADNFDSIGAYSALYGYTSSTGYVDNASNNTDSRDNGIDRSDPTPSGSPYGIISTSINLTANSLSGMPTGETGSGNTSTTLGHNPTAGDGANSRGRYGETDGNSDLTIDFGFVEAYALGNRVWFDTNNNSLIDAGETGIPGVQVALYHADAGGNPTTAVIADGSPRTAVTNAGGYYLFDYLAPGDYVVVITLDNFIDGGPADPFKSLVGYWSSATSILANGAATETPAPDPDLGLDGLPGTADDDFDSDDNGTRQISGVFNGAVISLAVTLGPNGLTEPISESDLDGGSQGNQPDGRANMTVDFGFYRMEVGNLVFLDANTNGTFDGTDTPITGAIVRLYASNGSSEIPIGPDGILGTADDTTGGMPTDASGLYLFSGLPAGDYIVSVTTPAGVSSTIDTFDSADNANPNTNTDDNDNGIGVGEGEIFSAPVSLVPGSSGAQNRNTVENASGTTTNPTMDFGFVATLFSLGNRVWFDTDNNNQIGAGEVGVNGVTVELYAADGSGNPSGAVLATDTTANGGYYLFDNLFPGDYVVVIPSSNFATGGVLEGYWSSATSMDGSGVISETTAADPDNNADSDDNGTLQTGGSFDGAVVSLAITLGPGTVEPTGESDLETGVGQGSQPDGRANMTVDFGFYRLELGNLVFLDVNGNGLNDAGDTPFQGATVQLFASDGTTEITIGPDGVLGTTDDASGGVTTGVNGLYFFTGLPQGDYIVIVTPPVGYASTVDTADGADTTGPNTNTDENDNGVGEPIGQVRSNVVTLAPGSTGAQGNNTVSNASGTTTNPTVDFGFVTNTGFSKSILGTSELHTSGLNVTIGEIITYEVRIDLPLGIPLTDVTITDRMQKGLAFVDCISVTVAGVDATASVCPPTVSAVTDSGDSPANPANPGRLVEFALGDLPAQTTANSIVIEYRAIALDVIENQSGVELTNSATWAWTGGSFSVSATEVEIIEPFLDIDKTATPTANVPLGTPVQFTLEIYHTTPQSQTDAFDVIVTDILPPNLQYVQCTVQYTSGLAPDTPATDYCNPGATTTDLIFFWEEFPLGETSTITFNAILLNSPATNVARVEWTSLEIDPGLDGLPIRRSIYNDRSHERWYDPPNGVDIYSVSDSVTITAPAPAGGGERRRLPSLLPATGFAPGQVTALPEQPKEKLYSTADVWLEIPSLGVKTPIVGVPLVDGDWDVSWLWRDAGWLDGTAFPGWNGNSALTGHVVLPDGTTGPFAQLGNLRWGDRIIVHAYGSVYTYEVRENRTVSPSNTTALKSEKDPWLTLITCENYIEANDTYASRIAVRAVLIHVTAGQASEKPGMGR